MMCHLRDRVSQAKPLLTVAEHKHGTNSHAHAHGFPYKCVCCNPLAHAKNLLLSLGSSSSALGILCRLRIDVCLCVGLCARCCPSYALLYILLSSHSSSYVSVCHLGAFATAILLARGAPLLHLIYEVHRHPFCE